MINETQTLRYGELEVVVHDDPQALAQAAAAQAAETLRVALEAEGSASVVLATGNSQLEFLARLAAEDVAWPRVAIFHMDEYVGLSEEHPASFRRVLIDNFLAKLETSPRAFHGIRGDAADLDAEIRRYENVLRSAQPCLCVLGIGENGHLAFNDPPALLSTNRVMHEVRLDLDCRLQQVGEGHFPDVEAVPAKALTLTVPALLAHRTVIGVVPERRKARAVAAALEGEIGPKCPASALRTARNATLHLDRESASGLGNRSGEG
jgi:glucosamine-6-phosphate deaminase